MVCSWTSMLLASGTQFSLLVNDWLKLKLHITWTQFNSENNYIGKTLPLLPSCKEIREIEQKIFE